MIFPFYFQCKTMYRYMEPNFQPIIQSCLTATHPELHSRTWRNVLRVNTVVKDLEVSRTANVMKEYILERGLMDADFVPNRSTRKVHVKLMREFIQERLRSPAQYARKGTNRGRI